MNSDEYATMKAVEDIHWWYRGLRSMLRRSLPKFDSAFAGVILDAGCGTGANLYLLRELAPQARLLGADISLDALKRVGVESGANLCQADLSHPLPLADATVDVLISCDVLGQRGVIWPEAMREFFRVLKPGGLLLLNVPAFRWLRGEHDAAVHVDKRFTPGEIQACLLNIGFQDVRCRFWNTLLLLPMLVRRLAARLSPPKMARSDLQITPYGINSLLSAWIEFETKLGARNFLPLGSSIFATARRPL